ncbi:MAG: sigma-70 family RNA polymerase sigma factor [Gemmatimonadales bacterium]|nr:sigma-70 family RNA polymerase sigma factor [Gemmatimonadales bacterium]
MLPEISGGDPAAMERLVPLVYAELRAIAAREMRHERGEHTLQPTALVHEAFLRLVGKPDLSWQSRAHFLNIAAQAMRRILVEHARRRKAEKRGGGRDRVTLDEELAGATGEGVELTELDDALERLAQLDPRKARIVELRFFAGLSVEEAGELVGVSPATVKREWQFAKAWIQRELARGPA